MKRFTETRKWQDTWYRNLEPEMKLAYEYIRDNCDNVGVWEPDEALLLFMTKLGEANRGILDKILLEFGDRIQVIKKGYWWLTKFVPFQYGKLIPNNKAHISYINLLQKHGIGEGLYSPLTAPQEKDKEKEKEKDKDNTTIKLFYKEQFEIAKQNDKKLQNGYFRFVGMIFNDFYKNALDRPAFHILKIPNQITFEQYGKLSEEAKKRSVNIIELLESMINEPKYAKGKNSLYLTLLAWVRRRPIQGSNLN